MIIVVTRVMLRTVTLSSKAIWNVQGLSDYQNEKNVCVTGVFWYRFHFNSLVY